MIAGRAILKVNNLEYDILRFNHKFQRDIDTKGRPCNNYYGGEISVMLESTDSIQLFQQMIHKDMPIIDGSIEVLSGSDGDCIKRIEFKEAYIYSYQEQMQGTGSLPMTTTVMISPMRLDFNNNMLRLDRLWPRAKHGWQKYVEEEVKYTKADSKDVKIIDVYWIDKKNRERRVLFTSYPVKLYIVLEEYTQGTIVNFHFEDNQGKICYSEDCSGVVTQNGIVAIEDFQLKQKK